MIFRIHYRHARSHVHCALRVGRKDETFAFSGSFVLRPPEFDTLREALEMIGHLPYATFEFMDDGPDEER
jgi:hypothetical protein